MEYDINLLRQKIGSLGNFLYTNDGLGLMMIIDDIFSTYGYSTPVPSSICDSFRRGLKLLRQTDMDQSWIDGRIKSRLTGGIENQKLVYENGEWHSVNMLNTSYRDLTDLLTEMVNRSLNGPDRDKGILFYEDCIRDPTSAFLKVKPHLKNLIIKYFVNEGGLDDFKMFVNNTTRNQEEGERHENKILDILLENGFSIEYRGGKGDYIDMLFGVDIIVSRSDIGLKTIQVKPQIYWDDLKHYKVDWIAAGRIGKIFDRKQRTEINIEPLN